MFHQRRDHPRESAAPTEPPHPSGRRIKNPHQLIAESGADLEGHGLKRTMGLFQLVCFGVGAVVGTGIFVGLSDSVAEAGPAVVLSFVLAAITCIFTAFSFAELGSAIPVSGSSYSFAYATLGERVAFLVGWCLLLEYGVSVSAVAVGWSQYVNELLDSLFGAQLPAALSAGPGDGGVINLPAVLVVMMAATLLVRGVRESAGATAAMAVLKITILILFCVIAFTAFEHGNLTPFFAHGAGGVTAGASLAFFSYIGFDAITTAGEEVKNPGGTSRSRSWSASAWSPCSTARSRSPPSGRWGPGPWPPGRRRSRSWSTRSPTRPSAAGSSPSERSSRSRPWCSR